MKLPRPRFTLQRMMVAVAMVGTGLGLAIHFRSTLSEGGYSFGVPILMLEAFPVVTLLGLALIFHLVPKDER